MAKLDARADDPTLWRLVQSRVAAGMAMQMIADEVGCSVSDLCDWVLGYRTIRRDAFINYGARGALSRPRDANDPDQLLATEAQRFINWRHEQSGAAEQIKANALADLEAAL